MENNSEQETSFSPSDIVALVNGEAISKEHFELKCEQTKAAYEAQDAILDEEAVQVIETQVLEGLVGEVLLYQAAQESGITVSEEDIEAGYAQVREEFDGDEMALADALFESGMTGEDLRAEIGERLRVQAYIETEIDPEDLHISDEDVETAYANYVEEMKDVPPLEEVFEEMRDQVEEQRLQQAVLVLIDKLREQSEVEVYI